jgi:hypothetical protein
VAARDPDSPSQPRLPLGQQFFLYRTPPLQGSTLPDFESRDPLRPNSSMFEQFA